MFIAETHNPRTSRQSFGTLYVTRASFASQRSVDDSHVPAAQLVIWAQTFLAGPRWLVKRSDVLYKSTGSLGIQAAVLAVLWLRRHY